MKIIKTYYNIGEVSKILDIKEHTIRYWDSKLPGLSKNADKGKTRFFTKHHINKISNINSLLKNYSSIDLAYKIITKDKGVNLDNSYYDNINSKIDTSKSYNKIKKITNKLKAIIN